MSIKAKKVVEHFIECDSCHTEIPDTEVEYEEYDQHICRTCMNDLPRGFKPHIDLLLDIRATQGYKWPFKQLKHGVWAMWDGREDQKDIKSFTSLTNAERWLTEADAETEGGLDLLDIFQKGKALNAKLIVSRKVVFE